MAAAVATIRKLRDTDAIAKMTAMGQRLREGLQDQSRRYGFALHQTGPVQMPQILFEGDPDFAKGNRFVVEALKRGAYLHPWHNMFLSAAHEKADIDQVLEATEGAFRVVREGA